MKHYKRYKNKNKNDTINYSFATLTDRKQKDEAVKTIIIQTLTEIPDKPVDNIEPAPAR